MFELNISNDHVNEECSTIENLKKKLCELKIY